LFAHKASYKIFGIDFEKDKQTKQQSHVKHPLYYRCYINHLLGNWFFWLCRWWINSHHTGYCYNFFNPWRNPKSIENLS